jgi:hypothetical protein
MRNCHRSADPLEFACGSNPKIYIPQLPAICRACRFAGRVPKTPAAARLDSWKPIFL